MTCHVQIPGMNIEKNYVVERFDSVPIMVEGTKEVTKVGQFRGSVTLILNRLVLTTIYHEPVSQKDSES